MPYDTNKLTKLAALKALAQKLSEELSNVKAAIPTNVSQLTNDSGYQTSAQVNQAIQTAISKTGHASFQKVDAVPEAGSAQENILYLVMNSKTKHYDIYAKVENEVVLLDDTTVDLTGYVQKDGDKVLSDNNYTDAEKSKLAGIAEGATKVEAGATPGSIKINGSETAVVSIATDEEVTEMLNEVFPASV